MNNAFEIKDLRKSYNDFLLDNISFSLPAGHIMGFVGQNGAGKTTTIRLMLNMIEKESGEVKIFGMDNVSEEQKIKQEIGVVFDDIYFVDSWKLSKVDKILKLFYDNWDSTLYYNYLKDFQLPINKKVSELSRGMKMKLMIAIAMSHRAKILILDEPTSGLDPVARDELLEILKKYISGEERSILFSTHITSDLDKIADYITIIHNGYIFYTGATKDLMSSFYIVRGNPEDLTNDIKKNIVGFKQNENSFAGLLMADNIKHLSDKITTEKPTIDDILIYISKGDVTYE